MELARSAGTVWSGTVWSGTVWTGTVWTGADLADTDPRPRGRVSLVSGLATGRSTTVDVARDDAATLVVLFFAAPLWTAGVAVEWLARESEAWVPVPLSAAAIPAPSSTAMQKPAMSSNAHRQNRGPPATVVPQRRAADLQQTLANGVRVGRGIYRRDAGYAQVGFDEGFEPVNRHRRAKRAEHALHQTEV